MQSKTVFLSTEASINVNTENTSKSLESVVFAVQSSAAARFHARVKIDYKLIEVNSGSVDGETRQT